MKRCRVSKTYLFGSLLLKQASKAQLLQSQFKFNQAEMAMNVFDVMFILVCHTNLGIHILRSGFNLTI